MVALNHGIYQCSTKPAIYGRKTASTVSTLLAKRANGEKEEQQLGSNGITITFGYTFGVPFVTHKTGTQHFAHDAV